MICKHFSSSKLIFFHQIVSGFCIVDDIQTLFKFKVYLFIFFFLHQIVSGFCVVDDIQTLLKFKVNFFNQSNKLGFV